MRFPASCLVCVNLLSQAVHHKDVTSQELVLSLRIEVIELQFQKDALQFAAAFNSQQYHALLNTLTQALALQHRHHERGCVRLLELQPMWRELQSASFEAPPEDVLRWIAENVPEEPQSLGRTISQRFLPQTSPRNRPRLPRKTDSGASSTNGSPRAMDGLKLSPRQMEKQPAPPADQAASASLRGLEPVSDPRPPRHSRPVEPIDPAAASAAPVRVSSAPIHQPALASSATRSNTPPPPAAAPPPAGSDLGSRHALRARVAELEATLRDVRTAIARIESTAQSDELKGALRNVILLATPSSPRSPAGAGLPSAAAAPPATSPRSSISVPAAVGRSSRSSKRLSLAPEHLRELLAQLDELPQESSQTPTYLRLTQLLTEQQPKPSAASPVLHRSSTSVPSAPSTALQGRSAFPSSSPGSLSMRDLMSQLLAQIKHESEGEARK